MCTLAKINSQVLDNFGNHYFDSYYSHCKSMWLIQRHLTWYFLGKRPTSNEFFTAFWLCPDLWLSVARSLSIPINIAKNIWFQNDVNTILLHFKINVLISQSSFFMLGNPECPELTKDR